MTYVSLERVMGRVVLSSSGSHGWKLFSLCDKL